MLRRAYTFAVIPAAVFVIAGALGRPTSPPATQPNSKARTESVREQRQDMNTFRLRWLPVGDLPPAVEVRHVVEQERDVTGTVPVPTSSPSSSARHRPARKVGRLDVCARHGMRKQITRRGKSWRCKR